MYEHNAQKSIQEEIKDTRRDNVRNVKIPQRVKIRKTNMQRVTITLFSTQQTILNAIKHRSPNLQNTYILIKTKQQV